MHHADFMGGLAAWLAGIRTVVWGVRAGVVWRNPKDGELKTRLFHAALRFTSGFMPRRIIGNSQSALDLHEAMGYPRRKFVFIPNGIDAERFCPSADYRERARNNLNIPADAQVVGFVGRFHPLKELTTFFIVLGQLQRERAQSIHAVVCGGAVEDLYPEARAAYEALPKRGGIHFLPFHAAIETVYPAFDLLLMCSGKAEAFPNVLLEAMACGVTVVATAGGDARLIVGVAGRVVAFGDIQGLVSACHETLNLSAAERSAQAAAARERAVNEYTMERAAQRFLEVYEEVAA
jgi:glycosyltransferase involved in cell wall biosynthesis